MKISHLAVTALLIGAWPLAAAAQTAPSPAVSAPSPADAALTP